jgi:hypothetical protein
VLLVPISPLPVEDLRDVKPPVDYPVDDVLCGVIDVLLIVTLVVLVYWMRRFLQRMRKPISLSPGSLAFRQLSELQRQNKTVKEYYFELTAILRRYIEARFAVKAPEMTTEEFLLSLKTGGPIPAVLETILEEFLQHCDLIKFADMGVTRLERENAMALVRRFIEETRQT